MRFISAAAMLLALALAALPVPASAQEPRAEPTEAPLTDSGDYWRMFGSPYTIHFHKDNDGEHEWVYMVGVERQYNNGWLWGATYFSNSFGQPSGFVYVGERVIGFSRWNELFFQWAAGIVYGYKEPYEDKIPFNYKGFAPGVIVSLGWQFNKNFSMQANALGAAGLMLQFSWDLR
jgi:hypothetical protein